MALFPLGMSGGIPCYLLLGEHGWKEMPAYSREEGEAGQGRSWWNKESWKDHGKWTSGCVQIAEFISLQGTEQVSICLGYGSSRLQQYALLLPSSWELSWVCKLRKNLYQKERKRKEMRQRINRSFSQDTVAVRTEGNKEPHSFGTGIHVISDIALRYLKCH